MIIYLTISLITYLWITYLWVRHKRESKREVTLADELIEDENGIIVTGSTTTTAQTIGRFNHNRDYFIPLRERYGGILEEKEDFIPKKRIKYHTLEEPIEYYSEPIEYYSENEAEDELIHLEDEDEGCGCDTACNCYDTTIYDL